MKKKIYKYILLTQTYSQNRSIIIKIMKKKLKFFNVFWATLFSEFTTFLDQPF